MEYGVCTTPDSAGVLAAAGFDFVELHVQRDLKTLDGEDAFLPALDAIRGMPLSAPVANCFVPSQLKITGPDVDRELLRAYAETAFERAARAGLDVIVFGSGGARRIPEGYDRDAAWAQLIDFGRMIGPLARAQRITVVVEPLNRRECNVLNSVGESAKYVRAVNDPNVALLVDAYHWALEDDSYDELVEAMPLIRHAHIATYRSRMAPGLETCEMGPFFAALKEGGYNGRLSIEGKWASLETDAPVALDTLKRLARAAGFRD